MNLFVGTSGYAYKEWKGPFYPAKLPDDQMLRFYGERFRACEINNTFYRVPKPAVLQAWSEQVPPDFRFVLKAPQKITHFQRLRDAGDNVAYLLSVAGVLGERLGPLLFQLPPNLKKDVPRLAAFLQLLPAGQRSAFEFRHASWLDEEVFALLRDHRAALCIAEAEDDLEVPFVGTADWGYLRLRLPEYDDAHLQEVLQRMQAQGWTEVFVFFKHEDAGKGPMFARRFLELAARGAPLALPAAEGTP